MTTAAVISVLFICLLVALVAGGSWAMVATHPLKPYRLRKPGALRSGKMKRLYLVTIGPRLIRGSVKVKDCGDNLLFAEQWIPFIPLYFLVPKSQFRLVSSEPGLITYKLRVGTMQHLMVVEGWGDKLPGMGGIRKRRRRRRSGH
jgi:hypothetical protein